MIGGPGQSPSGRARLRYSRGKSVRHRGNGQMMASVEACSRSARPQRPSATSESAGPAARPRGIGEEGGKVLLHLVAGSKEDTETVRAFFQDMRGRGLGDPLLVVSDGAPGIIRAIEECFPRSARQRCLAHRMRNLAVKVPTDLWPEFKARASACYQAPSRAIAR